MGNVEVSVANTTVFNFYKCFSSFKWTEYFFFNSSTATPVLSGFTTTAFIAILLDIN